MSISAFRPATRALLLAAAIPVAISRASLNFFVEPNNPWPAGWYDAAVANMQTAVNEYNAYGDFSTNNSGSIYVYYNSGIPTAQSGYGPYNGSIGIGGSYPSLYILLHESSHWLGTGTLSANWYGRYASDLIQQFDGVGAQLNGDSQHYWPYGENYGNESSPINDARHVAMVYALRKDFGVGSFAPPSSATSVVLSGTDAAGTSGFNYPTNWSDAHFPQPGTTYSTANYQMRTPSGSASWTFAGNSLTVNNLNGSGGGLLYAGSGTTGVVTFRNLILDGGYLRHGSSITDLFQLTGNVTLAGAPTIDASQGNIAISGGLSGTGSMTKAGPFLLTLTGASSYAGATNITGGTLKLSGGLPLARYTFDLVNGGTIVNEGSGGTALNGVLSGGATIVSDGKFGNAVNISGGASVNIGNPVTDLGPTGNWTVSAWVRTNIAGSTILSKSDGSWAGGNTVLYLGDGSGGGAGGIPGGVRNGGGFLQPTPAAATVNDGTWHLVTYVNAGGIYSIYRDSSPLPMSTGSNSFSSSDVGSVIRLGATTDTIAGDGTVNLNGALDDVRIYRQSLAASQIAAVYQGQSLQTLPATTNVSISAGAVLDVSNATQTIGSLTGPRGASIKLAGGQLTVSSSAASTFSGNLSGPGGGFTKSGTGTLTLRGASTYTGATTITAGTLQLNAPTTLTTVAPVASYTFSHLSGATVLNDGSGGSALNATFNLNGGSGYIDPTGGPATGMGALILNGSGTTVDVNSGITDLGSAANWTVSAWIKTTQSGATILNKGNGSAWASGYSTFYLGTGTGMGSGGVTQAVRYAGGFLAGSTVVNDGTWHLVTYTGISGVRTVYVDGVLDTLGQSDFINTDPGTKVRIGFTPTTFDGAQSTSGSLSGINFYSSALTAAQVAALYTAAVPTAGPLPGATPVILSAGATLDINGQTQTIGTLTGPAGSSVTLGTGKLTINTATITQFGGTLSGAGGSLVKAGSGNLILLGDSTFTGPTTVSLGAIQLGTGGATGSLAGDIINNAGLVINRSGAVTLANNISGTGSIQVTGAGTVTLTGSLSYKGNTLVSGTAGALVLSSGLRPVTGRLSVTGAGASVRLAAVGNTSSYVVAGEFSSVTLFSSGSVTVAPTNRSTALQTVLITGGVSLAATASLDLGNNDMLVHGGDASALGALVSTWYHNGLRDGYGLKASLAGGNGDNALAGLAVVTNLDGQGGTLFSTFDGVLAETSDVLVKYTYLGDTDLNGYVDGNDLGNLLAGMNGRLGGWGNGDFNYSGAVDNVDLGLLLASLAGQSGTFGDPGPGTSGAVPEPSALIATMIVLPLLGRRRRAA